MATITITKEKIKKQGGIVILSLEEYRKLCEKVAPTYYLKGKAAENADKLTEDGLKEYQEGKTIKASSLREALRIYEQRKNKN